MQPLSRPWRRPPIGLEKNQSQSKMRLVSFGSRRQQNDTPSGFRLFLEGLKPDLSLDSIENLTPERLERLGTIRGVLFDLDRTLIRDYRSGQPTPAVIGQLRRLHQAGFRLGVLSNNVRPAYCRRVRERFAEAGVPLYFIGDASKPSCKGFWAMANRMNLPLEQLVMVGDTPFTDIYGAHRAGLKAIQANWFVRRTSPKGRISFCRDAIAWSFWYLWKRCKQLFSAKSSNSAFQVEPA